MEERKISCPNCDGGNDCMVEDYRNGDMVCGRCGMVIESLIADSEEYRFFQDEPNGDPRHYEVMETATINPKGNKGSSHHHLPQISLSGAGVPKSVLVHINQETPAQKYANDVMKKIDIICEGHGATKIVREDAKKLFSDFKEHKSSKGRSMELIALAVFALSAKTNKCPLNLGKLAQQYKQTEKEVNDMIKLIKNALKSTTMTFQDSTTKPRDLMPTLCERLGLSQAFSCQSQKLADHLCQLSIGEGKKPKSVAAGIITFIAQERKEKLSSAQVARIAEVTPITLDRMLTELTEKKEDIIKGMDQIFLQFFQSS